MSFTTSLSRSRFAMGAVASGLVAAALTLGATGATASPAPATFSGSCSVLGKTTNPSTSSSIFIGAGKCTGVLDGRTNQTYSVAVTQIEAGTFVGGIPVLASGGGTVTFLGLGGATLDYLVTQDGTALVLHGTVSGTGIGVNITNIVTHTTVEAFTTAGPMHS